MQRLVLNGTVSHLTPCGKTLAFSADTFLPFFPFSSLLFILYGLIFSFYSS
jgi:hypothetical protein